MRVTAYRLCFLALLALSAPAAAQGATVTIGAQIVKNTGSATVVGSGTLFNRTLGTPGSALASPVDGMIVRWRAVGLFNGPFAPRTVQLLPGTKLLGVRSGAYRSLSEATATPFGGSTLYTFTSNLPIAAGQVFGVDAKNTSSILFREVTGSSFTGLVPTLVDGETREQGANSNLELIVNADVQPLPAVNLIAPATGPVAGGTQVRIAGSDFADVKAVEFGGVPAASYSVVSESVITAVAPPAAAGAASVSVTTIAGKSAASPEGQFTYLAPAPTCVVPKLTGKSLKADRKALKKAGCALGKVRRQKGAGKGAKVTKQSPKPGTVLPAGGSVGVKVG